ncbi:hypothetical protein KR032_004545, partial [Drosophila birchii]
TKMPADIVTTEQLAYQRESIKTMERTSRSWWKRFGWYQRLQERHYRRIDQIYLEGRQRYGDGHFQDYATRRRLTKKYTQTAANVVKRLRRLTDLEIDGCVNISMPKTTNGEYGLLKPTRLHFC